MSSQYHRFDNNAQGGAALRYVPFNGPDHVSLHRIWLFTAFQDELSMDEHLHLLDCEECCDAFRACIGADSFGAVLKALDRPEGRLAG